MSHTTGATEQPHGRAVAEGVWCDWFISKFKVSEQGTRATVRAQADIRRRGRYQLQAHGAPDIPTNSENPTEPLVEGHHHVAMRAGAFAHLTAPFGQRTIGGSSTAAQQVAWKNPSLPDVIRGEGGPPAIAVASADSLVNIGMVGNRALKTA